MTMKVMVRVDASRKLGIGHAVRCLTLAEELRRHGAAVSFACEPLPGNMIEEIHQSGFEVSPAHCVNAKKVNWLVVDHYELGSRFESGMRSAAEQIFVIDDLANREHDCDLLLDQNLYDDMEHRYCGLVSRGCTRLMGPVYSLLRPQFAEARAKVTRNGKIRRLLVFYGGSDPTNETLKTLLAIKEIDQTELAVDVLLGPSNPYREEIEGIARSLPRCLLLTNIREMSELMLRADLYIGAGGATTWERCCLGLSSIVIAVADNQEELSRTLARRGLQQYLGRHDCVTTEHVREAITRCLSRSSDMQALGLKGMELVDGLGAARVVAEMWSRIRR